MKTKNISSLLIILFMVIIPNLELHAKTKNSAKDNKHTRQILIIGLDDNVKSNYFYNGMIAEETGIKEENVDKEYNKIIANNIAETNQSKDCQFNYLNINQIDDQITSAIELNAENEDCHLNLSSVSQNEWKKTLDQANADYLLVINQHYLKWQETPLRTIFHIVSYTLFDKDKNELYSGNNYFTSMNLEKPEKLRKISKKASSKIASNITKLLDK